MSGLLRAELRRLTSRRLFRVLGLVFLGILLLVEVVSGARSREPNAFELQQMREARAACESGFARGPVQTPVEGQVDGQVEGPDGEVAGPLPGDAPGPPSKEECDEIAGFYDPRYSAADQLPEAIGGVAVGGALMAFVMGASFAGAEWAAGTMQALLFWEPRRGRVVAAKALALAGGMVAFVAVMQAVGVGLTMLVAATRGTTDGLTSGIVQSELLTAARGLIVVTFTGLLGFAVAGLARVPGAALGAAFVYFAILEQVIGGLRPGWIRYLVAPNVAAVVTDGLEVPARRSTELDMSDPVITLTWGRGTLTLAVYLALVLGAFYAVFSRRDVT